jgi:hypothetical protein
MSPQGITATVLLLLSSPSSSGNGIWLLSVDAYDYDDDYVQQVVEEDQQHYGYYDEYVADEAMFDEQQQKKQEKDNIMNEEQRLLAELERLAREEADRVAAERERKFQAELDRMDQEQKQAALKQKKKDHRKVQAVLKAASRNDLYGVLGMKNWDLRLPSIDIHLPGGLHFQIPGLILKETSEKDIRKQFRYRAKQMHPDKNKDGRAQEAFIAVENAAAILSDSQQRSVYDAEMKLYRAEQFAASRQLIATATLSVWNITRKIIKTAHMVLGPFFTSVMIIVALII